MTENIRKKPGIIKPMQTCDFTPFPPTAKKNGAACARRFLFTP
jgi:hypothetical protein